MILVYPIWSLLIQFSSIWHDLNWFVPIWSGLIQFYPIWSNLLQVIQFEPFWTNLNQVDLIWTNLDQFYLIGTILICFDPIWTNLDKFNPFWTDLIQNKTAIFLLMVNVTTFYSIILWSNRYWATKHDKKLEACLSLKITKDLPNNHQSCQKIEFKRSGQQIISK